MIYGKREREAENRRAYPQKEIRHFPKKSYRGSPNSQFFYIIINRETGRVKPEPLTGGQEAVKKIPAH